MHFYLNGLQIWHQQKFWFETHIDLFRQTNLTFRKIFLYFLDEIIHNPQYSGWNMTENIKYFKIPIHIQKYSLFSLFICFLANQRSIFHNFFLCCPSQRSARGQVPSQMATHRESQSAVGWGDANLNKLGFEEIINAPYHTCTPNNCARQEAAGSASLIDPRQLHDLCD